MPAAVRPRVGSRFESGSGLGLRERHEQVQAAAASPEARPVDDSPKLAVLPTTPAPDVAFDPAPVRERVQALGIVPSAPREEAFGQRKPEAGSMRLADLPPLTVPPAQRRARAAPRSVEIDDSRPSRTPLTLPPVAPRTTLPQALERVVHERTEQQTVHALIKSRVIERLTTEPRPPGASRPPTAGIASTQAPAPTAPRVEIHIGRIEVMPAPAPAAEPQRFDPPRPFPAQTLNAYLTERSSRHRL